MTTHGFKEYFRKTTNAHKCTSKSFLGSHSSSTNKATDSCETDQHWELEKEKTSKTPTITTGTVGLIVRMQLALKQKLGIKENLKQDKGQHFPDPLGS